ncbi:MAG: beta-ketoacyl-ACP synthase III [Bacteroidia bacterium]
MSKEVYITRLAKFLPNSPVSNDEMEGILGMIDGKPSRGRRIVLRNNGIKTRYYALDKNGNITHNNAGLTAEAVKGLFSKDFSAADMQLLACGTTSPDQLLPSHGSMVHGELACPVTEVVSFSGACCAGMHAMKYAYMSVLAGGNNAVCAGSEQTSSWMLARNFEEETRSHRELDELPVLAFEKDFLRWMLSDGAGAALLQNAPSPNGISFKIEWMDLFSFAGELETCMYAGADKIESGKLKGWKEYEEHEWLEKSIFSLKQDVKMLDKYIVTIGVKKLAETLNKHNIGSSEIDFVLPHISSEFFRKKMMDEMAASGIPFPEEKWFTNLVQVGNIGAASIFLMLEELHKSDKLKKGQKILLLVPESARFSYAFSLLTVV